MTLTMGHDTVSVVCRLRGHRFETQQYEDAHASFTVCSRCGAVPTQVTRLDMQAAVLAVYQDDEPAESLPTPEAVGVLPEAPGADERAFEPSDPAPNLTEGFAEPAVEYSEAPKSQPAAAAEEPPSASGRPIDLYTRLPQGRLDELVGRARELGQRAARQWGQSRSGRTGS